MAFAALVGVRTMLFVHSRVHRNPARNKSTAKKMDALCEYWNNALLPKAEPAMMVNSGD